MGLEKSERRLAEDGGEAVDSLAVFAVLAEMAAATEEEEAEDFLLEVEDSSGPTDNAGFELAFGLLLIGELVRRLFAAVVGGGGGGAKGDICCCC